MNREFLINIFLLVFINLLIKPVYLFGIDRVVQNRVPEGEYGLYFAMLNFTWLFQIVNDFGIQNFNNRNIAQHGQLLAKYFPNLLIIKGLLAFAYLALVFGGAALWGYESTHYQLLLWLAINQVLMSLVLFFRSNITALARYRLDSLFSVLDKLIMIVLCSYLLRLEVQFEIAWFVYAQTVALSLTALLAFGFVKKRIGKLRIRFRPAFLLSLVRQSYPYALVVFLMTVYTRIDGVMLERLLDDNAAEADIYASAYRLLDAVNMIGFLFAGLLLPMFARLLRDRAPVAPLVRLSFQLIWAGALSLAAATVLFREEIMVSLYTEGSAYSGQVLGLLIASFPAVSGMYIYGTLLTANGSLMRMNRIFLVGVVLNITLNAWLIPEYGALGAAAATCGTQYLVFFWEVLLAREELNLTLAWGMLLRMAAFLTVASVSMALLKNQWPLAWWWAYLLCLAIGGGLSLVFRLIHLPEWLRILRERPAGGI